MGTLSAAPFNVGGAEQIVGAEHVSGAEHEHFDAAAACSGRLKRPPAPSSSQSRQQSEQQSDPPFTQLAGFQHPPSAAKPLSIAQEVHGRKGHGKEKNKAAEANLLLRKSHRKIALEARRDDRSVRVVVRDRYAAPASASSYRE